MKIFLTSLFLTLAFSALVFSVMIPWPCDGTPLSSPGTGCRVGVNQVKLANNLVGSVSQANPALAGWETVVLLLRACWPLYALLVTMAFCSLRDLFADGDTRMVLPARRINWKDPKK